MIRGVTCSRTMYGIRISMSIGLVGVAFAFILGSVLGAVSGYYGGVVDFIIQRIIEFILCIPAIPLWMALSAAVPKDWPPTQVYFAISIILSLIGWCGLARGTWQNVGIAPGRLYLGLPALWSFRWLVDLRPYLLAISYLIVSLTLSIPSMILAETALSFWG